MITGAITVNVVLTAHGIQVRTPVLHLLLAPSSHTPTLRLPPNSPPSRTYQSVSGCVWPVQRSKKGGGHYQSPSPLPASCCPLFFFFCPSLLVICPPVFTGAHLPRSKLALSFLAPRAFVRRFAGIDCPPTLFFFLLFPACPVLFSSDSTLLSVRSVYRLITPSFSSPPPLNNPLNAPPKLAAPATRFPPPLSSFF